MVTEAFGEQEDSLQRFVFEHTPIRGEIVHLHTSYLTIMQQHAYPPVIRKLLAETLLATVLLSATIKFKGELTIQFSGDEPIQMMVAKCDDKLHIRGLARFAETLSDDDYRTAFARGKLVVTVQQEGAKAYQSIIAIDQQSIAQSIELYFAKSEQIPTKILLAHTAEGAAGLLLQLMPEQSTESREHFWEYVTTIGETIKNEELLTLDNVALLHRCYHPDDIRLFAPEPIFFRCRCTPERIENALRLAGKEEAEEILRHQPIVEVTCEFCNRHYEYDKVDIARIFHVE